MIKSFRNSGLKRFFETGKTKGIPPDLAKRLKIRLDFLNRASSVNDVNLPGWRLHELKGNREGSYATQITRNYRITFRFENGQAFDVNLEDYH